MDGGDERWRRRREGDGPPLRVRPLRRGDWRHIERLFGENGACGGCWCMWWRVPRGGRLWDERKGARNRRDLERLVEAGEVHGVIAFAGREPVGWCNFGPRDDFPRLETVRDLRGRIPEDVWCVVCFYIPTAWRRRGVATALLEAAADRAFDRGARELHGYPATPPRGKRRVSPTFAWMGVPALFQNARFRRLPGPRGARPVYARRR